MIRQMHPTDLQAKLQAGEPITLIDVRQPEEYAICHLPNSMLIPLGDLARQARELEIPDDHAVVVYCHHGVRSLSGAGMLAQALGREVFSLAGGIDAWSRLVDPSVRRY